MQNVILSLGSIKSRSEHQVWLGATCRVIRIVSSGARIAIGIAITIGTATATAIVTEVVSF